MRKRKGVEPWGVRDDSCCRPVDTGCVTDRNRVFDDEVQWFETSTEQVVSRISRPIGRTPSGDGVGDG
jgi:hypothetical protein